VRRIENCARSKTGGWQIHRLVWGATLWGLMLSYSGAVTPDSPEVQEMVAKAVQFLREKQDFRDGGRALAGLALIKAGADGSDPTVKKGVESAKTLAERGADSNQEIYAVSIAITFLIALDPKEHEVTIQKLLERLLAAQKPHGGWGYRDRLTGDTSMTQNAVLALWEASQAGFEVPVAAWTKVCNWLLRTQDPSGSFGYQGRDPGNFDLVRQDLSRPSLQAAALGSLYICSLYLGLQSYRGGTSEEGDLPAALSRVKKEGEKPGFRSARTDDVNVERLRDAQRLGLEWMEQHYTVNQPIYTFYHLYSLERMESFRNAFREGTKNPQWYEDGVEFLKTIQSKEGSFAVAGQLGPAVDTAFAVLFMVRSARKSLQQAAGLGAGMLVGGRGLPRQQGEVELRNGRVAAKPLQGPAEQLLKIIEDPRHPDYLRALAGLEELPLATVEEQLGAQEAKLRELAGSSTAVARLSAVRLLARTRDLKNVPVLIYALSDPDPEIVETARDGLEFISRKFRGLGPEDPTDPIEARAAIERWQAWYSTLEPDAEFAP
jgi:hypothetical protein